MPARRLPCQRLLLCLLLLPGLGGAESSAAMVRAAYDDLLALESQWYAQLRRLPAADEGLRLLRLQLPGALLGKELELELLRAGGRWLPGRAWVPALNRAVHDLQPVELQLEGDAAEGRIRGVLDLRFHRGPGWRNDLVGEMKLGGHGHFPGRLELDLRIFDGAVQGRYRLGYPPAPDGEGEEAAADRPADPFPRGGGDCRGAWTAVADEVLAPRFPELPSSWRDEGLAFDYASACELERQAEALYAGIRAAHLARCDGVGYAEALDAIAGWPLARPDHRSQAASDAPETGSGGIDIGALDDDGGGDELGLELGDELDALAEPAAPSLDPEQERQLRRQLDAIGARLRRMCALVERRAGLADAELPAVQRGGLDPGDGRFGPWYDLESLPQAEGGNRLPDDAGAAGPQAWPCVAGWSLLGPLPPGGFELDTPLLPELVDHPLDSYRLLPAALREGGSYKGDPLLAWRTIAPERPFGYVVPPNWSSANRVYRNCPRAITGRHSGLEYSRLYARALIDCPRDVELWAAVGVTQRGKLWLGDRLIWSGPATPRPGELEHVSLLKIPFRAGRNRLLLRCDVDYASPSFWLRICTRGRPAAPEAAAARDRRLAEAAAGLQRPPARGWRGDGSGVHPEATPPLAWHYKQGINCAWRSPLPYWSNATPVVVGDRCFVAMEPDTLLCFATDTGEELWRRRVSIIDLLPEAERRRGEELRAARWEAPQARDAIPAGVARPPKWIQASHWYWLEDVGEQADERRGASAAMLALLDQRDELQAAPDPVAVQEELTAVEERIERLRQREGGPDAERVEAADRALREATAAFIDFLGRHSRVRDLSGYWYDYDGYAFATPVSDGEHVWWKNGMGVAACFDLDGRQRWLVRSGGGGSGSPTIPSPLLVDGKLVLKVPHYADEEARRSDGTMLTALDAATGEPCWATDALPGSGWDASTPVAVPLSDGERRMTVIATAGGSLVRAADGHVLASDIGVQVDDASIAVEGDRLYFCRPNLVAVRLLMQDPERVGFQRLWSRRGEGASYGGVIVLDGLVYCTGGQRLPKGPGEDWAGLRVYDAHSGEQVAALPLMRKGGNCWSLHAASRDAVYLTGGDGKFRGCHPHPPAWCVAVSRGRQPQVLARNVIERSYGAPTPVGDSLFLRGYRGLSRVAPDGEAGRREAMPSASSRATCASW